MLLLLVACSTPRCPPEMAAIGADGEHGYCIDRYEVVVVDEGGAPVVATGGVASGSRALVEAGRTPTGAVTFREAMAVCARTPAHVDGVAYAQKHLATREEWLDAADGTVGVGGRAYPYGEVLVPEACNTPEGTGRPADARKLAASGAFSACVTPEGVHDLAGNLFEWVDPGLAISVEASLARFRALGVELRTAEDGSLRASSLADLRVLDSEATAIERGTLRRAEDGSLWMRWQGSLPRPVGYLTVRNEDLAPADALLPVRFLTSAGEPEARLMLERSLDGAPVTEKIGGAYYQDGRWPNPKRNHTPDFRGSIGFRCAAPLAP